MIRQPLQTLRVTSLTTASSTDAFVVPFFDFDNIVAKISGNLSGTSPTLDVYIQTSDDGGTTYYDLVHFAQLTTNITNANALFANIPVNVGSAAYIGAAADASVSASTASNLPVLSRQMRVKWVAGGTVGATTMTVTLYANSQSTGAGA